MAEKLDAVGRIVKIMELLCSAEETMTLREIESRIAVPRSTLHRLLASLEEREWVHREEGTEQFRPSVGFFLLNSRSLFYDELIRIASPEMERLVAETDKTAILSVLEGLEGRCIHAVDPAMALKFVAHRGMAVPVYAGATGKVLLAFASPALRKRIFEGGLPEGLDVENLQEALESIRRRGYAYSREEWMAHAGDISVPLFDRRGLFVAQLGLAGLASSFDGEEEKIVASLREATAKITVRL
ncbi:IclR family transcriptional regulator [Aminithiophilus ramosus]|uniref:IclR family transcriptional regulator n=2 Tax=Synergistales TaxID=649776 RepID=A0A9Q7F0R1_9BACT|nr:IclR family transcriptional regulator [Aminithiophilus ramosus]QTX33312.1 IclR family transcriptional regulator [Aminithiophilus ramosus]QVL36941.1 IclR family transcriptional regulator [Synergistota bacterium]